jgi:hypothetical protein
MNQCQLLFISALAEEAPGAFPDDDECISIHCLSCARAAGGYEAEGRSGAD